MRRAREAGRPEAERSEGPHRALRSAAWDLDDRDRGQPFHDAAADEALFSAVREDLAQNVELHELDIDVNDPGFALAMADRLHEMLEEAG